MVRKASCTGWSFPFTSSPSIVVTSFPATEWTGVIHEGDGLPFINTVHAPQAPSPQPYLLPVRQIQSRSTANKSVSGSTVISCCTPLTFNIMIRVFYHHV